jgi:hypothetical protein
MAACGWKRPPVRRASTPAWSTARSRPLALDRLLKGPIGDQLFSFSDVTTSLATQYIRPVS